MRDKDLKSVLIAFAIVIGVFLFILIVNTLLLYAIAKSLEIVD